MSDRIEGYVADVRFVPGHPSGEILVGLRGEPGTVTVLGGDPAAVVKFDGESGYKPAGVLKLLYVVQRGDVFFSGEALPGRNRTCRVAEFRTVPKE